MFTLYNTIVFLLNLGYVEIFFIQNRPPNITVHSYCDRAREGPVSLSCSWKRGAWGAAEISIAEALPRERVKWSKKVCFHGMHRWIFIVPFSMVQS